VAGAARTSSNLTGCALPFGPVTVFAVALRPGPEADDRPRGRQLTMPGGSGMQERRFGRVINIGSEASVAIVPGLAAYCVSKHALGALTEVIQDANHDHGIKAWVICPGFVDTEMGQVVPGANRDSYLQVNEVVDVARFLVRLPDNVKVGPQVLIRTMRNPMTG
jgi:NAD(P)-dependent dehydrogenase (short-subunit alcohol dehydrogenase family)